MENSEFHCITKIYRNFGDALPINKLIVFFGGSCIIKVTVNLSYMESRILQMKLIDACISPRIEKTHGDKLDVENTKKNTIFDYIQVK